MRLARLLALLLVALAWVPAFAQNQKRLVLQGFWWDFRNQNYPQGWANYLADLAPRLKALGVRCVWIPPSIKNANPFSVGYSPFDQYDLGDKYQKSNLKTPLGDKDELLRMIAVLHANGIEVMQDIVPNHMDGAGSASGAGAIDAAGRTFYSSISGLPTDPTGGNKHFRYSCFATAATDETATDYLNRRGRWPKNWQNFYPNPSDNRLTGDDLTRTMFGPDIGYNDGSFGQTSLGGYDPQQQNRYMRDGFRNWLIWYKKQTGIDGFRIDAVKHFPTYASEDFLFNLQFNSGFASGTSEMLAVGEWVGGKTELDAWTDAVQGRAGTFDFALRGFNGTPGLNGMVYGLGNYDMSNLPSQQQDRRFRTFPFVNNHDTFRPPLQTNGDYPTGRWNSSSELASNIDPREPRLAAAYAVMLAVDGNPVVFFEDLFDVGTTGKRYSHLPTSTTDLPMRSDIANLVACHNKLGFKDGAYLVPYQSADHLIIERSGKAIIGTTDNFTTWQTQTITSAFPSGTRLIDYGGSSPATDVRVVGSNGQVQISTPPCNGTALRRGYSVWAPEGQNISLFSPAPIPTAQEWEMADDLGDSHPRSLGQGGQLPANSFALRKAGKIYPDTTQPLTVNLYASDTTRMLTVLLAGPCGTIVDSVRGRGNLTLNYAPVRKGWLQIMARQGAAGNPAQRVWLKASYKAPATVNALASASFLATEVELGQDRALCQFQGQLSAFSGPGFNYQWRDSAGASVGTGQTLVPPYAGRFSVLKTNVASGCTASDTVRVLALEPLPTQPQIRRQGDTLVIDAQAGINYQWNVGGGPITGATGPRWVPTRSGGYSVTATSALGCRINSPFVSVTVSVRRDILAGATLAPNPAQSHTLLQLTGKAARATAARLLDALGRPVLQLALSPAGQGERQAQIELSALPAGLYLVEIVTPEGQGTLTLMKQ